jgi:predicted dinucleotide-binding enzyme
MMNGRLAQSLVGVLGSGEVGRRLAAGFFSRGHGVMIGSRDPGNPELREWLTGEGAAIEAGTFAETAAYGELLVLAVLGTAAEQVIAEAGPGNFSGKVVIDATNPLDFSGGFPRISRSPTRTRSASESSARFPTRRWSRRSTRSATSTSSTPASPRANPPC